MQIFGRSLFQPEYKILKKAFDEKLPKEAIGTLFDKKEEIIGQGVTPAFVVEELAKIWPEKTDIKCQFFESSDDVPDPTDLNREKKNLMIFDHL